jgi:hypothetical protein
LGVGDLSRSQKPATDGCDPSGPIVEATRTIGGLSNSNDVSAPRRIHELRIWTTAAVACGLVAAVAAAAWLSARFGIAWAARRREAVKQPPGYQAGNITAFRSSTIVLTIKRGADRFKVLQVVFGKDGSLFVTFPYFRHRTGLLSATTSPATGRPDSMVSLEQGGRVTSHLVKYSHHPTGLALFSQTGKVRSEVRRQSVKLDDQEGHLFTVLINGLHAFSPAQGKKDEGHVSPERTVVTVELPPDAGTGGTLKIVGRWHDVSRLRFANPVQSIGPFIGTVDPDGQRRPAVTLANPSDRTRHVLLLTCAVIPRLGTDSEMLLFIGGFDPRETMNDTTREAGFLAFRYPAGDADDLKHVLPCR